MRAPNNDEIKRLAEAQRKVQRAQLEVAQAQTRQQQAALDYDEVLIEVQSACHVPPGSGIDLARKVWLSNPETSKLQALELDEPSPVNLNVHFDPVDPTAAAKAV